MKSIVVYITLFLVLVTGYYFFIDRSRPAMVGNDADEHGCIGSAGYSWCPGKSKCLRPWEEPCEVTPTPTAEFLIRQALAEINQKPIDSTFIKIKAIENGYASGSVAFSADAVERGLFLAYLKDSQWTISYHGNGSVDCPALKSLGYPLSVLNNFCD